MSEEFKHLAVRFYTAAKENKRKSVEAGRPVYDDIEMVEFRIAGDPKTVHVAPAHDQSSVREQGSNRRLTYAQLHSGPYEAFKRGQEYIGSGTPLKELTFLSEGKRKELQALNVHTCEQLAALDGSNLARLGMGGRSLKTQAQAYLDKASGSGAVSRIAQENEDLKARLAALEAMMASQTSFPTGNPVITEVEVYDGALGKQMDAMRDATYERADIREADENAGSPFADWDIETLRVWYTENGGGDAQPNWKRSTYIKACTALNDQIRKAKEAA